MPAARCARWPGGLAAARADASHLRNAAAEFGRFHRALAIFPHPDDETITCGGVIRRLADAGVSVTVVLLTAGERGTPTGVLDPNLKAIRRAEAEEAARHLRIAQLIQEDFGDGQLRQQAEPIRAYLTRALGAIDPDVILTYDLTGYYGHPDHVACAEMVTEVRQATARRIALWYVALPTWERTLLERVGQLQIDPANRRRSAVPTHRLFIGPALWAKIRAWSAHRSQRDAIPKGLGRFVPAWLAFSIWPFEYVSEVA